MAKLTNYEKETIITFNDGEEMASIYTCNSAWMRKLDALMKKSKGITIETEDENSKSYLMSKKAIKVRLPRVLIGEKRKELILRGQRLAQTRKNQFNKKT